MKFLDKYNGKKVCVLYSGGLDSGLLAHHLLHGDAEQVALAIFDCGSENSCHSPYFDSARPIDFIKDIWQYERYANLLQGSRQVEKEYLIWPIKTPELQSLSVNPENLKASENATTKAEEDKGLVFYSGFVLIRFAQALAVASKYGYDYIITGHMAWNEHYEDESSYFAYRVNDLFDRFYGNRLKKVPIIEMPLRFDQLSKVDLIKANEASPNRFDYRNSISCNVSVLDYNSKGHAIDFATRDGYQIHCGQCLHCLDRKKSFEAAGVVDNAFFQN